MVAQRSILALLFLIAAFLGGFRLSESPPIWYDEGIYSQVAASLAQAGRDAIPTAPHVFESAWSVNSGFPFIWPVALSYMLFGVSVEAGRTIMVLFLLLFLAAAYALARRLFSPTEALLSLALLATFPILYATGKSVLGEVPGLLYLCLFLLALARIEREGFASRPWLFALSGLLLGLTIVTKPTFLPLLGGLALAGAIAWRRIPWRLSWMAYAALGFIAPIAVHALVHLSGAPGGMLASYYANPYAVEVAATVRENLLRFVTEATPAYCALLFLIWGASLAWRALRRERIFLPEMVAFFFALLILLFYLRTAGWYRYFFLTNTLALLFLPSSLAVLAQDALALLRLKAHIAPRLAACAVGALVLLHTYQLGFSSWVASHYDDTTVAGLTGLIEELPDGASVGIVEAPELAALLSGHPLYQYMEPAPGFVFGAQTAPLIEAGVPDMLLVRSGKEGEYADMLGAYVQYDGVGGYAALRRK